MKCYLALTAPDDENDVYADSLEVALLSGLKNTSLNFIVLYDGDENNRCYKFLKQKKIHVIKHKFTRWKYIPSVYSKGFLRKNNITASYPRIASTFMRLDVPFIEQEDEFVLYCDIDVYFNKDIDIKELPHPKYLAAAPEFDPDIHKMTYFNAGVLLLNVKEMRKKCSAIFKDLENGIRNKTNLFDQGYLNQYCFKDMTLLPIEYNWKPYWGINHNACIIHYHGLKPNGKLSNAGFAWSDSAVSSMLVDDKSIAGLIFYFILFFETLGVSSKFWMSEYITYINRFLLNKYYNKGLKDSFSRFSIPYNRLQKIEKMYNALKKIKHFIRDKIILIRNIKQYFINFYYDIYPLNKLNPDVSVIVTSYNYDRYIEDTLNSLINQTLKINKIVVIDDGSTDNSVNIIQKFAKNYDNILFIQHPDHKNHGLAESIKYALSFCNTRWIAFCESDDLWDKHHFEYLVKKIKQFNVNGIYASNIKLFDDFDSNIYMNYLNYSDLTLKKYNGKNIFNYMYKSNILPTFSAVCVPKIVLEKCNFDTTIPQYLDFWLWRQISKKYNVFYANKSITLWRKHLDSWDRRDNISDINEFLEQNNKIW